MATEGVDGKRPIERLKALGDNFKPGMIRDLLSETIGTIEALEVELAEVKAEWSRSDEKRNAEHVKVMAAATDKRQEIEAECDQAQQELAAIQSDSEGESDG